MTFRSMIACVVVCGSALAAEVGVVEEIIAKVNGDIITRSEVDRSRKLLEGELKQSGLSGASLEAGVAQREKDILRERIDQLLLVQKAKELSISVDAELGKYMAELQTRSGIADPDKFQQWIREQTGQAYEDFRNDRRNDLLTQRVVRQEIRINIPRSELEKYYNEHKSEFVRKESVFLREILISTEGKDDAGIAAAEKKARDLAARAKKGEKFHELAKQHSDAVSKNQWGELGAFERGGLNKQIADIVFVQERGFVTDPIRVQNGFLILRVEDKHRPGQATFEEVENEIMEKLYMPRFEPQVREYLTKLRQEAFLEIKAGYVDSGAAPGKDTKWTDPAQLKPETVTKEEVAAQTRRRRLLWVLPIPGTSTTVKPKEGVSKSQQ
jgi:peptidyl-prolyl cis-trans isomerase SurA